jgi:adenine C2-methylase RlmN of 23S rRNA A2503 and tRNA A37
MTVLPNIRDLSLEEIEALIACVGKEKYRARQIMKWLYRQGDLLMEMTTRAGVPHPMEDHRIAEPQSIV